MKRDFYWYTVTVGAHVGALFLIPYHLYLGIRRRLTKYEGLTMSDELEQLKRGDFTSRFRYLYVTKLKKFSFFRGARNFFGSDLGEALFLAAMLIPAIVFLLIAWPFMYWKSMREQKEYAALYQNRERGWHPNQ